ncbi:MAG: hypothetical protein NTW07_06725, partial [candidate division Zixibacteria bacterium]|nr:hypothetical protein [candidate division Zixibacteria bacterium]
GGFMVGGLANEPGYRRDYIFVKLNPEGDTLWTYMVGGGDDDHGRSVIQTYDGNYAMAGKSSSWVNGSCTWLVKIGEPSCCVGRVGDANGLGVYPQEVTVADIMTLVTAKYISLLPCEQNLHCLTEADANQSGGADPKCSDITMADIQTLVNHLFIAGPVNAPLKDCF